ncbi:MAG: hypothetical protein CMB97_17045, partial [Flavobacteriaceae bacterium]|nr:hypothetical protein [Flavobacteriaceae bacterium]
NIQNWIGNGFLLPAGPLRENLSSLKNYTAVFHLENYYERKDKFIAEIYNTRKLDPFSADIYELIVKKEQFQLKHKILSKCLKIRKSYVNSKKKLKKILRK